VILVIFPSISFAFFSSWPCSYLARLPREARSYMYHLPNPSFPALCSSPFELSSPIPLIHSLHRFQVLLPNSFVRFTILTSLFPLCRDLLPYSIFPLLQLWHNYFASPLGRSFSPLFIHFPDFLQSPPFHLFLFPSNEIEGRYSGPPSWFFLPVLVLF